MGADDPRTALGSDQMRGDRTAQPLLRLRGDDRSDEAFARGANQERRSEAAEFVQARQRRHALLRRLAEADAGIKHDITFANARLGRDIKLAGFSSRVVFGRGLVRVHWASGAKGLIHVMTKNLFSAFRFRMSIVLLACLWMTVFCVGPVVALMFSGVRIPAAATLAAIGLAYLLYARQSRLSPWYALLYPVAAVLFIYILLRSMIHTLRDGGVTWRETFYPLADLRAKAGGLW